MTEPVNVEGLEVLEIQAIMVRDYHALPDGQGPVEEVHLWIEVQGFQHPMILRFKSPAPGS